MPGAGRRSRQQKVEPVGALNAEPFWSLTPELAAQGLGVGLTGISTQEATARATRYGPNTIEPASRSEWIRLLVRQFESPIILILVGATIVSAFLGNGTDAAIILAIVLASGLLGFWQERDAAHVVAALIGIVQVRVEALRDGAPQPVSVSEIVPGDVVRLNAGDVVPGDCLLITSNHLLVDEAALTGESYPSEKQAGALPAATPLAGRSNVVFMGTHVVSGAASVLVMRIGPATAFGSIAAQVRRAPIVTGFELGMARFGYLLVRVMVVIVGAVFGVNLLLHRPIIDSALFSLALAVGITPQLLPAIVTICLAHGTRVMAREQVIVKRLDAIEDFGSMTVLCTDKTGTMTAGRVTLAAALDPDGRPDDVVLRLAALNARLQHAFDNPLDAAIVEARPAMEPTAHLIDEIPYDFTRRRLSVLIEEDGSRLLITKGALAAVLAVCTRVQGPGAGAVRKLAPNLAAIRERAADLGRHGYRVLGVATRERDSTAALTAGDETNLTLRGLLTFLDPPKPDVAQAVHELGAAGISLRMITGDNRLVAEHVASLVGLAAGATLTGEALEALDDADLAALVGGTSIFAEIEPSQKARIIRAFQSAGEVVGYLGDGINDAPALHAADVGISVDSAAGVAKEAAAIVLLAKDLRVLLDGVREGRKTFANTMKYVFINTSASFGNMLSMAIATGLLPYLPMRADQILLLNLLTDIPIMAIATDSVDPDQTERPQRWNIGFLRDFMIVFGAVSSVFDLLTFGVLRFGFQADAALFQSAWFVESAATEIVVIFLLRTRRPLFRSRPGRLLQASSLLMAAVTLWIPFSPLADPLGFTGIPAVLLLTIGALITIYALATETAKGLFYRRRGAES